ncbi:endonuclease domain-containing 1 protein-like [Coregonus clupeaformis]|uniref:endonuclease domain-containing 1 protein-like n=1 Tax=Coregonus clupeaformis TaxID=59861 RepID=UPI001BE07795|nr:endonuclease domain-containing 1 protein-like [Coregonus clupeaformis]XP_041727279.1 endonuclease domain-containing 1 protein-like [Coregonus clupeaformis]XP_045067807.1 endonuclease domain-containing 1 protein-like [Coregonus clupeaformis]
MSFLPPRPEEGDVLPASKTCLRKCWVGKFSEVKECSDFFLEGTTPNLPGILVDGTVQDPNRYKLICQKYKNSYRFATLYDTTNKIPVFSAYTFTGPPPKGRPNQPWMIEPQVVNSFDPNCRDFFLNGTTPNITNIFVGGRVQIQNQNPDRYKLICQKYNNKYRFATLYDTTNKIPVFSAYTYTGYIKGKKRNKWKIEPQLNNINDNSKMILDDGGGPYPNQAGNNDYKEEKKKEEEKEKEKFNRGHLFPFSYAIDQETKDSTFTLTNIVPQVVTFNGGSWEDMECDVRNNIENNCKDDKNIIKAYVVTGAAPSESNKLNNRVNIPKLLWTAYCCNNSQGQWVAEAHWGVNKEEKNGPPLVSKTLAKLYEKLSEHYPGVQVFPDECSADNPTALRLVGGDVHDHCVYDDECVCSSVGIKGHYLPVVLFSVLVMRML